MFFLISADKNKTKMVREINVSKSKSGPEKEYHIKRWQLHYGEINSYYEKMSSRLTIVFGIITAAVACFSYLSTKPTTPAITEEGALLSGALLIPLFFIHEMKIFLRLILNYYPALYHAYILSQRYKEPDFKFLLDNSFVDSSLLTIIFMFLSNSIVFIVSAVSIRHFLLNFKGAFNILGFFVSVVSLALYLVCIYLTYRYYRRIHSSYSDEVKKYIKEINGASFAYIRGQKTNK